MVVEIRLKYKTLRALQIGFKYLAWFMVVMFFAMWVSGPGSWVWVEWMFVPLFIVFYGLSFCFGAMHDYLAGIKKPEEQISDIVLKPIAQARYSAIMILVISGVLIIAISVFNIIAYFAEYPYSYSTSDHILTFQIELYNPFAMYLALILLGWALIWFAAGMGFPHKAGGK